MRIVVIDFETFFGDDYTLSKMSTEAYIRDPRFQAHGAAIKWSKDHDAIWYVAPRLRQVLKDEDWSDVFLISHHAHFDHLILNHHYDVRPKMSGCTLSMARLLLGNHISVSLDSVRAQFALAAKTTPYNLFKGKHWHELTEAEQNLVAEGACDEVESIWKIFGLLAKDFPAEEYEIVNQTVRMFTQPVLQADVDLLAKIWERENVAKRARLDRLGVSAADLQSADKFADLLRAEGVEPETKPGKPAEDGTPCSIYCFAKTDRFMEELLEDEDDRVRALAEARLGQKSTLLQTRAETLGFMASRGPLCVYLRYAGTGTLRVSGGDGCNWLNFKRRSDLRRAVLAPPGYLLGPVDASQIEFRVCMYLAGQEDVLELLRNGGDPYVDLASVIYGERIYKPTKDDPRCAEMEMKRGAGKQGRLMCIYGASGAAYQRTARTGLYGPPVDMTREEADRHVQISRDMMPAVCTKNTGYWAQASRTLSRLAGGDPMQWGPLTIRDKRIYLPNGCPIIYDTLEYYVPTEEDAPREFERQGYWRVQVAKSQQGRRDKEGRNWKTMWGSKLVQNVCEAVSRCIVSQAMIRCAAMGYRALNWPYDELLFLVPKDGHEEEHLERCRQEMIRPVPWLPGLPLDAEAILGERYAK